MNSRSRRTIPVMATHTQGSQSRIPRSMPVISPESRRFTSATGEVTQENFSLISAASGSRRTHGGRPMVLSPGSYSDDDLFLSTTSAMSYPPMTASESPYALPVMSSLNSYDIDLTSEFLTEDAFSTSASADLTLVPSQYHGQNSPQEEMNSGYMPMDSLYLPCVPVVPSYCTATFSPQRLLTPPPENYLEDILSAHMLQDALCPMDKKDATCEASPICSASSDRSDSLHFLSSASH